MQFKEIRFRFKIELLTSVAFYPFLVTFIYLSDVVCYVSVSIDCIV